MNQATTKSGGQATGNDSLAAFSHQSLADC